MNTDVYGNETNSINWIGTDNLPKFLREVRGRYGTDYRCHVGVDQLKVAWVIFRPQPDKDICITFEADRKGLESFAENDLLVHGKCTISPYMGITVEDYFSTFEFDQSIDQFFAWGNVFNSALVARIMEAVSHRVIRSSVYWEPTDDSYAGLIPGCQYMEWDETCDDTIRRSLGQTRRIVCANEDGSLFNASAPGNIAEYTYYRKIVAESNGALMLLEEDDGSLRLARRNLFRAEWHRDAMFGDFKFTINPDFTKELKL